MAAPCWCAAPQDAAGWAACLLRKSLKASVCIRVTESFRRAGLESIKGRGGSGGRWLKTHVGMIWELIKGPQHFRGHRRGLFGLAAAVCIVTGCREVLQFVIFVKTKVLQRQSQPKRVWTAGFSVKKGPKKSAALYQIWSNGNYSYHLPLRQTLYLHTPLSYINDVATKKMKVAELWGTFGKVQLRGVFKSKGESRRKSQKQQVEAAEWHWIDNFVLFGVTVYITLWTSVFFYFNILSSLLDLLSFCLNLPNINNYRGCGCFSVDHCEKGLKDFSSHKCKKKGGGGGHFSYFYGFLQSK